MADTPAMAEPTGCAPACPWLRHKGLLVVALFAVLAFYTRSWEGDLHGDPVHYAAVAKCILSSGDWLSMHDGPGVLYARKPPLMFWLVAVNFKLFGVSTYTAKFWSCAFGVGVCLLTFLLGRRLFGETAGLLAGLMMATFAGIVPNVIDLRLDSSVAFFTALAVYGVVRASQEESPRWLLLPGLAAGLGMMVKPSAALHVAVLSVLLLAVRRPRMLVHPYALGAVALAAALAAPWHLAMMARHGAAFTGAYFGEQIASRVEPGWHILRNVAGYLVAMSSRALPWWPLAAYALLRRGRAGAQERAGMLVAVLWVLAILLLMAVPPKVYDRYMVPAYPAVALLAGWGLAGLLSERARARVPAVAVAGILVVTCLVAAIPFKVHTYHYAGYVQARPMLDLLAPGPTIAAYVPDEPPGPSRLPDKWNLRSCTMHYLDRECINYALPQDVAAAGQRFVIAEQKDRSALAGAGYEPVVELGSRLWLFERRPAPPGAAAGR